MSGVVASIFPTRRQYDDEERLLISPHAPGTTTTACSGWSSTRSC